MFRIAIVADQVVSAGSTDSHEARIADMVEVFNIRVTYNPDGEVKAIVEGAVESMWSGMLADGHITSSIVQLALNLSVDVVIHMPAATRFEVGSLQTLAQLAKQYTPGFISVLTSGDEWNEGLVTRLDWKASSGGFEIRKWRKQFIGKVFRSGALASNVFAYTPESLRAIGGWNFWADYPGPREIGLSLRAWLSDCPIYLVRPDVLAISQSEDHDYEFCSSLQGGTRVRYEYPCRAVLSESTWKQLRSKIADGGQERLEGHIENDLLRQQAEFVEVKRKADIECLQELGGPGVISGLVATGQSGLYCVAAGLGNVLMSIPAMKALADFCGRPIDVFDVGVQVDGVLDLLRIQPFINDVISKEPKLEKYRYIVGSYWGNPPSVTPFGSQKAVVIQNWQTKHEVECNIDAVRSLGYNKCIPSSRVVFRGSMSLPFHSTYVVVGIACGSYQMKRYPNMRAVCQSLERRRATLVFLGSQSDSQPWMGDAGFDLCGGTSISEAAAILAGSDLYLGVDNGLSHLAAAVGTPSVILYGPSSENKNAPWSGDCTILRSQAYACGPCWGNPRSRECSYEQSNSRPCMLNIDAEVVVEAVLARLDDPTGRRGRRSHENNGSRTLRSPLREAFRFIADLISFRQQRDVFITSEELVEAQEICHELLPTAKLLIFCSNPLWRSTTGVRDAIEALRRIHGQVKIVTDYAEEDRSAYECGFGSDIKFDIAVLGVVPLRGETFSLRRALQKLRPNGLVLFRTKRECADTAIDEISSILPTRVERFVTFLMTSDEVLVVLQLPALYGF